MDEDGNKREINRALVLCGGGAKGAYAFGCLQAFKEREIYFDAVAGTSVGALNALLWSTNSLEKGKKLWDELSFSTVYPVQFIDPKKLNKWFPKWFTKYLLQGLAAVLVFFHMTSTTMKGIPIPDDRATRYTSLFITIPCSIPSIINFLILFPVFLGLIIAFIYGLLPIENGWWSHLEAVFSWGFLGIITFGQLYCPKEIYLRFNKGQPEIAMVPLMISSVFSLILLGILFLGYLSRYEKQLDSLVHESWLFGILLFSLSIFSPLIIFGLIISFPKFVSVFSEKVLNKLGTVLDSAPLYETVKEILVSKSPGIPTYITTASLSIVFDSERSEWVPDSVMPRDIGELILDDSDVLSWKLDPLKLWIPHYIRINTLSPEESALYCAASAALPFGIVPSIKIAEKDFVDGGVIDNIPFYPLVNILPAKEIYIVLLENFESDEDAQIKSKLTINDLNEMERLQVVVKLPKPPSQKPPKPQKKVVDHKKITELPKLVFFYPKTKESAEKIGGFVNGTLRFESKYAQDIMSIGREETLQKLNELSM